MVIGIVGAHEMLGAAWLNLIGMASAAVGKIRDGNCVRASKDAGDWRCAYPWVIDPAVQGYFGHG